MLYFIFAVMIVLLDQMFKYWVTIAVKSSEPIEIINGVIRITNIRNSGAAFGLFADMRWVLVAISAICIAILIAVIVYNSDNPWGKLGLAGVLGGALGNFIDRLALGNVIDMLEFEFVNFAVFNIADVFITLGGVLFCLTFIVRAPSRAVDTGSEAPRVTAREHADYSPDDEFSARIRTPAEPIAAPEYEKATGEAEGYGDGTRLSVESILEEYYTDKLLSEYDDYGGGDKR